MDQVHNETNPARNLAPPPVCHKIKHCYGLLHVSRDRALHGRKVDISPFYVGDGESGDARVGLNKHASRNPASDG
jgi:hypothetical protein